MEFFILYYLYNQFLIFYALHFMESNIQSLLSFVWCIRNNQLTILFVLFLFPEQMLLYPRFLIERFLQYDLILILLSQIPPRFVQKGRREIRKFDPLNCWKREGVVVGVVVEVGAHNDCRFPNTASSPSWMKKRGILATIGGLGRNVPR